MAERYFNREQVVERLKREQGVLTQKAFAIQLKVSQPFLNNVYSGFREPSAEILDFLGMEEAEKTYRMKKGKR